MRVGILRLLVILFQEFGDILKLVPLAESVVKLTSVCMMCFGEASFTKRKGQEKEVRVKHSNSHRDTFSGRLVSLFSL